MIRRPRSATAASWAALITLASLASPAPAQEATRGRMYTGPHRILSTPVPTAPNWAGVPYRITALDTKGDTRYDKVLFHADDFGQYLVAGARVLPGPAVAGMEAEQPLTVLRNLSQATLMGWRDDLSALPEVARESTLGTKHGEALVRVYRVAKGSILVKAQGRQPTPDDAYATNIASVVARRGAVVVFVLAQNDTSPDDEDAVRRMATELFDALTVSAAR